MLGLMRAIDSFDPSRGSFGHWAFKPIQREVLRAVRNADHPNVNMGDFERRPEILRAQRQLQGDDGRLQPTCVEVAAAAGASLEQVRRVVSPPRLESIDQPIGSEDGVTVGDLDRNTRQQFNIPAKVEGAVVMEVDPNSPSYRAGLREGMVIQEVNRKPVTDASEAVELSDQVKGKTALLKVWNNGGSFFVVVKDRDLG